MKVHKNFLSKEEFDKIKEILLGPNFSWFYNSKILSDSQPLNTFQFTHTFFKDYLIQSNYFNLLKPITLPSSPTTYPICATPLIVW